MEPSTVVIDYTNYRGVRAVREIIPRRLWWGRTDHHPEAQWLLDAWDAGKGELRTFAMADIHSWRPAVDEGLGNVPVAAPTLGADPIQKGQS